MGYETLVEALKHLPGQHDQSSHAGGRGHGAAKSSKVPAKQEGNFASGMAHAKKNGRLFAQIPTNKIKYAKYKRTNKGFSVVFRDEEAFVSTEELKKNYGIEATDLEQHYVKNGAKKIKPTKRNPRLRGPYFD